MPAITEVTGDDDEGGRDNSPGGGGERAGSGAQGGGGPHSPAAGGEGGEGGGERAGDGDGRKDGDGDGEAGGGEESLTEAEILEREERLERARGLKLAGNQLFAAHNYAGAAARYTEAIEECPEGHREGAVFYNNRATCFFKMGDHDRVVQDCSAALRLDPDYTKCLLRRAQAYEMQKKLADAYDDFQKVVKLDGSNSIALAASRRLEGPAKEEREKQKEEMMGKLKDLGNSVLGRFGMSLDNFKTVQDPNTGSYSISYNPGGGGE